MRRSGEGRIVNIASLSGVYATEKFPGLAAYNVSKYGVIGLTEAIAAEGKEHGISAICISPGAVDTADAASGQSRLRPGLTPGDVAELIVALLDSPLAAGQRGEHPPLLERLARASPRVTARATTGPRPRRRAGRRQAALALATRRAHAAISESVSSSGSPPRSRPTAARSSPSCR